MKNLIHYVLIASLLISTSTPAKAASQPGGTSLGGAWYVERRPEAIQEIKKNGLGASYNFMGSDGGVRRFEVVAYHKEKTGPGLIVKLKQAEPRVVVNFDSEGEAFTISPASDDDGLGAEAELPQSAATRDGGQENTQEVEARAPHGSALGSGLRVGVGSGLVAAFQVGLIQSSGLNAKIAKAFQRIENLQVKMGGDFARIEAARFKAAEKGVAVIFKLEQAKWLQQNYDGEKTLSQDDIRQVVQAQAVNAHEIQWLSSDQDFLSRAKKIQVILMTAPARDQLSSVYHGIAREALIRADRLRFDERVEEAEFLLGIAKTAADVLIGLDPITGFARSVYESITGRNVVTGQPLSDGERVLAFLGLMTSGYVVRATKAFHALLPLVKRIAPELGHSLRYAQRFFNKTEPAFQLVGKGSLVRKVNLRSNLDANWGLTPKHLKKHFFSESRFALKQIDPGGSPDTWMQNMAELFQKQEFHRTASGAHDVISTFKRTDGRGSYRLGVRLWPKADGTFDLITVLTDQNRM